MHEMERKGVREERELSPVLLQFSSQRGRNGMLAADWSILVVNIGVVALGRGLLSAGCKALWWAAADFPATTNLVICHLATCPRCKMTVT
jgi:hypothetical protein